MLLGMLVAIVLRKFRPPFSYALRSGGQLCNVFACCFPGIHGRPESIQCFFPCRSAGEDIYGESWEKRGLAKLPRSCFFLLWTFMAFQGGLRRVGVFDNNQKNFLYSPRADLYFHAYKRVARPYIDMVNFLAAQNPQSIGLGLYDDAFEYPLWALLSEKVKKMPTNLSSAFPETTGKSSIPIYSCPGQGRKEMPLSPCLASLEKRGNSYIKIFPPDGDRE